MAGANTGDHVVGHAYNSSLGSKLVRTCRNCPNGPCALAGLLPGVSVVVLLSHRTPHGGMVNPPKPLPH